MFPGDNEEGAGCHGEDVEEEEEVVEAGWNCETNISCALIREERLTQDVRGAVQPSCKQDGSTYCDGSRASSSTDRSTE